MTPLSGQLWTWLCLGGVVGCFGIQRPILMRDEGFQATDCLQWTIPLVDNAIPHTVQPTTALTATPHTSSATIPVPLNPNTHMP